VELEDDPAPLHQSGFADPFRPLSSVSSHFSPYHNLPYWK